MRVKRIKLTDAYKPFDMGIFRLGDTLEFDCYVKRINGFVVVIPVGTKLAQKEITLLERFETHYIKYSDYKRVSLEKYLLREKRALSTLSCQELMGKSFQSIESFESKLEVLYNTLTEHLKSYFRSELQPSLKCAEYATMFILSLLDKRSIPLKNILNVMKHSNRHEVHLVNVMLLSILLAKHLGFSLLQIKKLALAALLHDLGKSDVPEYIFDKKSQLSEEEKKSVQEHSYLSYKEVQKLGVEDSDILNAILHHHEYLDGSGYPGGLMRKSISLLTQIITLCDMFDAMTSERGFREKMSALETLKIIKIEYKKRLNERYINEFIKFMREAYTS